eukprot:6204475-Pleurochrysis_carterae.AAC.3
MTRALRPPNWPSGSFEQSEVNQPLDLNVGNKTCFLKAVFQHIRSIIFRKGTKSEMHYCILVTPNVAAPFRLIRRSIGNYTYAHSSISKSCCSFVVD